MEDSTTYLRIVTYLSRKTLFVIQSVTFLLTIFRNISEGGDAEFFEYLEPFENCSHSVAVKHAYQSHVENPHIVISRRRISVYNLWKCFESAYEVEVQCIEYFVVDRDKIDPHALWDLNWVNFPLFSGVWSINQSTLQHI